MHEHLLFLEPDHLLFLLIELFGNLRVSLVNSLLSIFEVCVPLLDILKRLVNWITHLSAPLFHFFVEFGIQKLNGWDTIRHLGL